MFYQNVFDTSFIGVLLIGDKQMTIDFRIPANVNTSIEMIAWNNGPYNLTSLNDLTINYSFDSGASWSSFTVDVTTESASDASVTAYEIAECLNAHATFKALYEASVIRDKSLDFLKIRARRPRGTWKSYISNTSAESRLRFNKKAGVAELPSFFSRHVIGSDFEDSLGMLIELSDPITGVDTAIVEDAGFDTTVREDWELLEGRSGIFIFTKKTYDGSNRLSTVIEYNAGASEGALAKKTTYEYSGVATVPSAITEIPYVLQSGDLVTPP